MPDTTPATIALDDRLVATKTLTGEIKARLENLHLFFSTARILSATEIALTHHEFERDIPGQSYDIKVTGADRARHEYFRLLLDNVVDCFGTAFSSDKPIMDLAELAKQAGDPEEGTFLTKTTDRLLLDVEAHNLNQLLLGYSPQIRINYNPETGLLQTAFCLTERISYQQIISDTRHVSHAVQRVNKKCLLYPEKCIPIPINEPGMLLIEPTAILDVLQTMNDCATILQTRLQYLLKVYSALLVAPEHLKAQTQEMYFKSLD